MRSRGQDWAFGQLLELVNASAGAFEIFEAIEPVEEGRDLVVTVTVDCRGFDRRDGGLQLKLRERVQLDIPSVFPLARPRAYFTHKRYGDYPHVQWGKSICLYQAPETEWNASRGMFGFMLRLHDWLKAASAGELDPVGMELCGNLGDGVI